MLPHPAFNLPASACAVSIADPGVARPPGSTAFTLVSAQTRVKQPLESARVGIQRPLEVSLYPIEVQAFHDDICVALS